MARANARFLCLDTARIAKAAARSDAAAGEAAPVVATRLSVHEPVDDLCKKAADLCTSVEMLGISAAAQACFRAVTCENTGQTLCMSGKPKLSTCHGAAAYTVDLAGAGVIGASSRASPGDHGLACPFVKSWPCRRSLLAAGAVSPRRRQPVSCTGSAVIGRVVPTRDRPWRAPRSLDRTTARRDQARRP